MKIYLAGSIAGGRKFEKNINFIADKIETLGHTVVTQKNVVQMKPGFVNAKSLSERKKIMNRDKRWLKQSDAFIAEVSTYSHGVGYEHRFAEENKKPILLLRHKSLKKEKHSAFLDGTDYKNFVFAFYDKNNINSVLKRFFKKYVK